MKSGKRTFFTLLVLTYLCSTSIKSQVNDTTMSRIYAMDMEELLNTKVSIATKSEQTVGESPAIVSVITADEIKNMGARELEDVLQMVPGFELSRGYSGYYGIGVRGVKDSRTTSKILMLIDGIPFNQVFSGNTIPWGYDIDIQSIEKIEIIRGPGSALYGRNAFSAVINIITKSAKSSDKFGFHLLEGSFRTQGLSSSYAFRKEAVQALFSVRTIKSDVTDAQFHDDFGRNAKWNIFRDNVSVNTKISAGNFTFSAMYLDLYGGAVFSKSYITNKIGTYSLSYNKNLNPRLHVDVKMYGHYSKYMEDIEYIPKGLDVKVPASMGGNDTTKFSDVYTQGAYYKPQSSEYLKGIEAEVSYKIFVRNEVLIGIQNDNYGIENAIIPSNFDFATGAPFPGKSRDNMEPYKAGWFKNNGHSYTNLAFLCQDVWQPIDLIGITLGARYDFDSEIGGTFNPRTGLVISPWKDLNIKLLYGRAYRAPAPSEQYVTIGYAFGNENLKPEIINTFEFSVSQKTQHATHSISLFANKLNDMIYAAKITYIDPNNKYYNIGQNKSTGFEYENKFVMGKKFFSFFNYSFTISTNKDTVNGKDTSYNHPDIAPHRMNLGINYSINRYFNFNCNMLYRSRMEKFKIGKSNIEVQDNIGNYAVFNATMQCIDCVHKGLTVRLSAYNVFDQLYYSQDNQHLNQPHQAGRQIILGLSYVLK